MTPPGPPFATRFAPSPTGPLHFGSLVAALGGWIEARHHGGVWHVRIDDLDPPREEPGAADAILHTLTTYALEWDGPVVYQSQRGTAYQAAIETLREQGLAYPCGCTRKEIQAAASAHGPIGVVYPGTCRDGLPAGRAERAVRVRTMGAHIAFTDRAEGRVTTDLEAEVGDFVIRRADGLFAYHLACAVDDAAYGYTHIIRGRDLLACTPPQIHLQRLLGLPEPEYHHLPLARNQAGQKLSKQNHAPPLTDDQAPANLVDALALLGYTPPPALRRSTPAEVLAWALAARGGSEPSA
ncbi:tRNA glutamyl-Q(34) synthetase GluQRS [Halorhodospira halophila]|uniref:Glutamyl-Q tRNA(Asp) synthetase n=1 Tax=Halorhodospira halophila (strain DSM 244 / SL1) TaxID=349124 RepID=A1WY84_HALHL|nr:tRNA glutamyl-Q(34) synthetase GluQRS [Halorhodospira halophila]ABM62646.1 glutamyl-tRNA synthetase, class Ic [Halorhodospira halophila SL1]MBK1728326.1 tRNA glutamyl-Q(34) synthetase GluQRS [Halorhodospira halophila]